MKTSCLGISRVLGTIFLSVLKTQSLDKKFHVDEKHLCQIVSFAFGTVIVVQSFMEKELLFLCLNVMRDVWGCRWEPEHPPDSGECIIHRLCQHRWSGQYQRWKPQILGDRKRYLHPNSTFPQNSPMPDVQCW